MTGRWLIALAGLDRKDQVILSGDVFQIDRGPGFESAIWSFRIIWLSRRELSKPCWADCAPWLEQAVIADFISKAASSQALRRIRRSYMSARDALIEEINGEHLPGSTLSGA